ncbi:MAG: peptidoglycan-binding protein [Candidatus Pacebacteria bacterium]|nr:peptidoglycan-binding protein [Candidatus Paceibacterota bacterium]MBP9839616.1 peptidoglycan-binding protein [Candidatus Paceibacterota bacterium]
MKKILSIFRFVLPVLLVAVVLSSNLGLTTAATLSVANGSFGSGSNQNDISSWEEKGDENASSTLAKNPDTLPIGWGEDADDTASPDGGRFAKIGRYHPNHGQDQDGSICQQIDASGFENLVLKYYWRGDSGAEDNSDLGKIEYLFNGSCESADNQWTNITSHELNNEDANSTSWSTLQALNLPDVLDNEEFFIRFRGIVSASDEYFRVDGVSVEGDQIDVCKNMEGVQTQVPQGYSVNNQNECIPDVVNVTVCKKDDQGNLLSGWMINLDWDSNVNHHWDATTGEDGCAYFNGIHSHDYIVSEVNQTNWSLVSLPNENGHIQAFNLQNGPYYVVNHYTPPTPTTATIHAQKIVCDSEDDLPNWGAGNVKSEITSTTASEFLADDLAKDKKQDCHLENWQFAWSENGVGNPGDNKVGVLGNPWHSFNDSFSVPATGQTVYWVREEFKDGYIHFGGENTTQSNSAEIYCATDVLNYDNWEYLTPVAGEDYYCVAFNVPEEKPLICNPEENLLKNGSFETPEVSTGNYGIFPQATLGLEWLVDWVNVSQVGTAGLEIQDNVAGAPAVGSGNQFAELDANHPVKIWQDVPTINGQKYELSFKYSPRPNVASNNLEAWVDGTMLASLSGVGSGATNWSSHTYDFTADANTTVKFTDIDTDDSYGGYVDDVSLNCVDCDEEVTTVVVSDTTNTVGDGFAVETYEHNAWVDEFGNAKWIWDSALVTDPAVDQTKVFTKTFPLTGEVVSANIKIAADNGFILKVNGQLVVDKLADSNYGSLTSYNVAGMLYEGSNTIEVTVKNFALNVSPQDNPAGVIYELTINTNECEDGVPPPPVCPLGQHLVENQCVPNPQCSDTIDNGDEEDSLSDQNDPGCHTDGNVNNGASYDPNDDSESNQSAQCSDGLDNDKDERVDSEDPGCHSDGNVENPSSWVPEDNNEEDEKVVVEEEDDDSICSDGKDNDGDNVADFPEDEGCESAKDDSEDNRKILGGGGVFSRSGGSVLGASTDICDWDASYLRKGWKGNNPEDVKKVQNDLLNALEGHNLTVDGVFGPKTEEAIKAFQAKYAEDILKPWGIDSPTGLFYLSSLRQAQKLLCPEKEEALPQLINWSANPAL